MMKDTNKNIDLRKRAETKLQKIKKNSKDISSKDIQHLIEELLVHQTELELENKELRNAQNELEESRNKYYSLYDFSPVSYFTLDKQELIVEVNLTGIKMLDSKKSSFINKPFSQFVSQDSQDVFQSHIKDVCKSDTQQTCEIKILKINGNSFNALLESRAVKDKKGNVSHFLAAISDIDEHMKTEEALKKSEEKYHKLVENLNEGVWVIDEKNCTTFVNPRMASLLGYTVKEMEGKLLFSFMDENSEKYYKHSLKRYKQKTKEQYELTLIQKDGSLIYAILQTSPIIDEHGKYGGAIVGVTEITERVKLEKELGRRMYDLGKRIKELNCLYGLSKLVEKQGISIDEIFQGIIKLAPSSWQYPEITCARLIYEKKVYKTDNFMETSWKQSADIMLFGEKAGNIEVNYLEERPESDEGPFLKEERNLLDAIAERLGRITELRKAEEALEYRINIETLIASISNHFVNLANNEINHGIQYTLEAIGKFSDVDRSYVFLFKDDNTFMENTHEWCAEVIKPQIENLKYLRTDNFPWWMEKLNRYEFVHIPRVSDLSSEAVMEKDILQAQNIQSLIVVPLVSGGALRGFMGFDTVRMEKTWKEEDIRLLNIVGEIIVHSLERKKVEDALRESEEWYRSLFETMDEGVVLINPDGNIIQANPGAERLLGLKRSAIEPRHYTLPEWEILRPDGTPMPPEEMAGPRAIKVKRTVHNVIMGVKHPDNNIFWINVNAHPIIEKSGKIEGLVTTFSDITELKRADEALRKAHDELEVRVQERTSELAKANEELRIEISERQRAEKELIQGQSKLEVMVEQKSLLASIASRLNSAGLFHDIIDDLLKTVAITLGIDNVCMWIFLPQYRKALRLGYYGSGSCISGARDKAVENYSNISDFLETLQDGRCIISSNLNNSDEDIRNFFTNCNVTSCCITPITTAGNLIGYIGYCQNREYIWKPEETNLLKTITDIIASAWGKHSQMQARLEAEKKQTEAVQMAEKASRLASIGVIAGGITHEINQPLTAIKITADSIIFWEKRNKGLLPEKFMGMLKKISESVDRIDEIIQHIRLFWTTPDKIEKKTLDLNEVVLHALSLIDRQLHSHGIKPIIIVCDSPVFVLGNDIHLEQVVINLVVNAMNSLDSVKIKSKKIEVITRLEDDSVVFEVKDNGTGLPEGVGDTIFDPFFSTRKPGEGMGLGLAIVKRFVDNHKGVIDACNNPSGGSSFTVRFPVSPTYEEINNEHTFS